jgi:hypothetical protein
MRLCLGWILGLGIVLGFWWWVGDRLTMPTWLAGIIPASLAGLVLGLLIGKPGKWAWVGVILLAAISVIGGTWWPVHVQLTRSASERIGSLDEGSVHEQVMQAITRMEEGKTDLEEDAPAVLRRSIPWSVSRQVAWEQVRRSPWLALGHFLFAGAMAGQGMRIATRWGIRE